MKIVLDIYGGDNSPYAPIDGAVRFIKENGHDDTIVILAGDEKLIKSYFSEKNYTFDGIEILHAPDEVTCHDEPTRALRKKPDSSLAKAILAVASGDAQGIVSSGSTGVLFAGSLEKIKRIRGITRPALTPLLPTLKGTQTLLIDSGANADCTPEYLAQFALMGSAYMHALLGISDPKVTLISNGTEDEKGNTLTLSAHKLLRSMPINFIGNSEARDVLSGNADVLVCDGFTGNILLKTLEGSVKAVTTALKEELMSTRKSKIGALLIRDRMKSFKKKFDYRETGGAPILGINGCVIKAHGSSDATAYKNALEQAHSFIMRDVVGQITHAIANVKNNDNNA